MAAPTWLSWDEAVTAVADLSGAVLIVGGTDTGKSHFALAVANAAAQPGNPVWVVDSDLGQSVIGPPGTVGVGAVEEPVESLEAIRPRSLSFVGALAPPGHTVSLLRATHRMTQHARDRDARLILVDTCGLAENRLGERLKLAKLETLRPTALVLLERQDELQRLARLARVVANPQILRVRSPREATRKSTLHRRAHRVRQLGSRFQNARTVELDAGSVISYGGWPFTGQPLLRGEIRQASEALGVEVLYAEDTPDALCYCVAKRPNRRGMQRLEEFVRGRPVVVTPAFHLQDLLVGLIADDNHLVDIALLRGINFERRVYSLWTAARSLERVRILHYGRLRARADGVEIVHLRPNDL